MRTIKNIIKKILGSYGVNLYHFLLPEIGALVYGYPAKKLIVIGVTGTKGKSSVTEMIASILRADNKKVAVSNSIQFTIGENVVRNTTRMSMPGRITLQKFLYDAHKAGCTHAVIEITSEGSKLYRHRRLYLDMLIITNLAPEHIESHGSFENYREAKLSIVDELIYSPKHNKCCIVNSDDPHAQKFIHRARGTMVKQYSLTNAEKIEQDTNHIAFTYKRTFSNNQKDTEFRIVSPLLGTFNIYNLLASLTATTQLGVNPDAQIAGVFNLKVIPGRAQKVIQGQPFDVVVDYAHTPESLQALYEGYASKRKICVLGATGGGRDKEKRPRMGAIADNYCDDIILTDEDPYDEVPQKIVDDVHAGITKNKNVTILMDRAEAISVAVRRARPGDAVLITGKGTDPSIARAKGMKEPWSDFDVANQVLIEAGYSTEQTYKMK